LPHLSLCKRFGGTATIFNNIRTKAAPPWNVTGLGNRTADATREPIRACFLKRTGIPA